MLRDATWCKRVIIKCGRTDLRRGISGLVSIIRLEYGLDPLEDGTLFLFCGKRRTRLKALAFEGDGFTLVYHRINENGGRFYWPMSEKDVLRMTPDQYRRLMNGFTMDPGVSIRKHRASS